MPDLQEAGSRAGKSRVFTASRIYLLAALVLLLGGLILYLRHAFQFFMDDDEGTYAYAAWRISMGDVPYRDFLTSEMPVFLYWGGLLVRLFGRSFVALRLATIGATVLAGGLLYAANCELFGRRVALLSLGLFLVDPDVYGVARCFRAEAYMLLFAIAGLWAFIAGEKRSRLGYTVLSGVLFGLSALTKLFGFLPLAGCATYLLYAWWRERRPWRVVVRQGLALGLPAVILVGLVTVVFTWISPYFFAAVFTHHTMQGADMPMAERVSRGLAFLGSYLDGRRLIAAMAAVGVVLLLSRQKALPSLDVWVLPTALGFLLVSRDLNPRYLVYLTQGVATLSAMAVVRPLDMWSQARVLRRPWRLGVQALVLLAALALEGAAVFPWMRAYAAMTGADEHDSARLAGLIQSLTNEKQAVITDYPGLNFLAGRRSTYWAAEISAVTAQTGQVSGARLIQDMERQVVGAVIIDTSKGAHHLAAMPDYGAFRRYLQTYYVLTGKTESWSTGQSFEVYTPSDTMPLVPGLTFGGGEIEIDRAWLSADTLSAGSSLEVETRWRSGGRPTHDYYASVLLVDASGRQWAEAHTRLQNANGAPTSGWQPGQAPLVHYRLDLSPALPAGDYSLIARAYDADAGFLQPDGDGASSAIAPVHVLPPAVSPVVPSVVPIAHPLASISFGRHYDLLGYDVSAESPQRGDSLRVTLYWAYREPATVDYKMFVHLLDGAGQVQSQCDRVPSGGGAQTSGWVQGDVLVDHFDVPIAQAVPTGPQKIEVGFYDPMSGKRLLLQRNGQPAGEDRLILPVTIAVR